MLTRSPSEALPFRPPGAAVQALAAKPRFQVTPPLSDDDYAALKADIAERGVMVPVEYDELGNALDGHHRIQICEELGIERWPRLIRYGLTEAEKRRHARQLNLARRHLDSAAKRQLIADDLLEDPERSNRQVAAGLGVSPTTVGTVRDDLEGRVQIGHVATHTDTKGRKQPARKKPGKVRYVPDAPAPNRTNFTGEFEWYTPRRYIELVRSVLGEIDTDPASHLLAQQTVRAAKFYTREVNGLAQEWWGRIFLNPPYMHPLMVQFVDKLLDEIAAGRVSEAILLTHNYTDSRWFHKAAARCDKICFTKGRIAFVAADGGNPAAPTQGQAFFYFGPKVAAFERVFAEVGAFCGRWT